MSKKAFTPRLGKCLLAVALVATLASAAMAQDYAEPETPQAPAAGEATPDQPTLPVPSYVAPTGVHNSAAASTAASSHRTKGTGLSYTVRPGDSLSAIGAMFGVDASDIARANHISVDAALYAGKVLHIPNPFAIQVRALNVRLRQLTTQQDALSQKAGKIELANEALRQRVGQLTTEMGVLGDEARMLPWWRGAAFASGVIALLMLGVTLVALLEWWVLRRRFVMVVEMNESLRRLDQKYKLILAKAELRLQELYGRRRRGMVDGQERAPLSEEAEIELLDRQLREILERHLEQLGGAPKKARRHARWRTLLGGVDSPVEARSARR
jgi:LysM repeat protein